MPTELPIRCQKYFFADNSKESSTKFISFLSRPEKRRPILLAIAAANTVPTNQYT